MIKLDLTKTQKRQILNKLSWTVFRIQSEIHTQELITESIQRQAEFEKFCSELTSK